RDPQLQARGHFTPMGNDEVRPLPLEGVPFHMDATPPHTGGRLRRGPPLLGQDNDAVLRDVLGMDDTAIATLREEGALE
ncbi:MAG TPA: hypothetical protein VKR22_08155, partial [Acidimicrobiales bacterium]|nr:hypothetical protein [Acidimicrobiales bacterium]